MPPSLADEIIRGVTTNIGFIQALLEEPDFLAGRGVTTSFIDERPPTHLLTARTSGDRATKICSCMSMRERGAALGDAEQRGGVALGGSPSHSMMPRGSRGPTYLRCVTRFVFRNVSSCCTVTL